MAYTAIYTGTIVGSVRRYTLTLEQRDALVPAGHTSTTIYWLKSLVWQYGEVQGGTLARGSMSGSCEVTLIDPNRTVFDHIASARTSGAEDKDFRLHIESEDGTVSLYGIVRIKLIKTNEDTYTKVPETTLQVYDGIADSDRLIVNGDFINELIDILTIKYDALNRAIPVEELDYRTDFATGNAAPGFPFPVGLSAYLPRNKYKRDRTFSKIVDFWTYLVWGRLWQGFDGRWHLEQPHLTGREGAVLRVAPYTLSFIDATDSIVQLTRAEIGASATPFDRSLEDPVVGVTASRVFADYTDPNPYLSYYYNIVRAGSFDSDDNRPLEHWLPGSLAGGTGEIDTRGSQGDCLLLDDDESNEQALPFVAADEKFYLQVRLKYALENVSTSGTRKAHMRIRFEPHDTDAHDTLYVTVEGTEDDNVVVSLTATDTTIKSAAQSLDANAADPLTWYDWYVTVGMPAPFDGRYVIELMGCSAGGDSGYNTCFDMVQAYIANPNADDGAGVPARTQESTIKASLRKFGDGPLIGEVVDVQIEMPHISAIDGFSLFDLDEVQFYSHFDFSGTPSQYSVNHFSYAGTDYTDYLEMIYAYLITFANTFKWAFSGTIKGMYPPETPIRDLDGVPFVMLSGAVDMVEETTTGRWIENPLAPVVVPSTDGCYSTGPLYGTHVGFYEENVGVQYIDLDNIGVEITVTGTPTTGVSSNSLMWRPADQSFYYIRAGFLQKLPINGSGEVTLGAISETFLMYNDAKDEIFVMSASSALKRYDMTGTLLHEYNSGGTAPFNPDDLFFDCTTYQIYSCDDNPPTNDASLRVIDYADTTGWTFVWDFETPGFGGVCNGLSMRLSGAFREVVRTHQAAVYVHDIRTGVGEVLVGTSPTGTGYTACIANHFDDKIYYQKQQTAAGNYSLHRIDRAATNDETLYTTAGNNNMTNLCLFVL